MVNRPLIAALMELGKPLLVSTGTASIDEVRTVTGWLGNHPHVLLQCVSGYPTPDDSASLAGRAAMCRVNPNALGYSDDEIRNYVESDVEKARMRKKGKAFLAANGVNPDDPETFCTFGRAEIAKNSAIGALLRAN